MHIFSLVPKFIEYFGQTDIGEYVILGYRFCPASEHVEAEVYFGRKALSYFLIL